MMITIHAVTKYFGQNLVLKGIDLEIRQGEFVSLLGPSGCGKTTLLRCLAGLESIDGGEISIAGKLMSGGGTMIPPEDRNIGMIFQSYALWPHMTVAANIAYGLKLHRRPRAEVENRVAESLNMVGLSGYGARYPAQLSGGQQQRVALARSVAMRPQVLLFDEPLSNLDAQLRVRMRSELRDLQRQLGITAVYVTHDQAEAMATSDRIVLMRDGLIIQQGTPYEMYTAPATAYAAGFLGAVNYLPARVTDDGNVMTNTGVQLTVDVAGGRGKQILLGIRQDDVLMGSVKTEINTFEAQVVKAVFMGSNMEMDVKVGGHLLRAVIPARHFPGGVIPECILVTLPPARLMCIPTDDLGLLARTESAEPLRKDA